MYRMSGPALVILLGALLSASGAFWAALRQSKAQQEIRSKNDEIARLSAKAADSIIGGNSFCYVSLWDIKGQELINSRSAMLMASGEYPLYDIEAVVMAFPKGTEVPKPLSVTNLKPMDVHYLGTWHLPSTGDRVDYEILFTARNGTVQQLLSGRRMNGEWKFATVVFRQDTGQGLFEMVPDGFPKDSNGHIDWVIVIEPSPNVDIRPIRIPYPKGWSKKKKERKPDTSP